jgi:acetylornithine aminotransferase
MTHILILGSHGTTFGGSVLASRLGHHVLSRISDPAFISSINTASVHLRSRLERLPSFFPSIVASDIRGRGLIIGIPFKNPNHPAKVVKMARERGVLLLTAGDDAVRLLPSLTVSKEETDHAMDVLESCLSLL